MPDIPSLQGIIEKIAPWITIIGLSLLFWKIPVWKTKIEKSIEHIENNLGKLEKKYERGVGRIENNLDKLEKKYEKSVEHIGNNLDKLEKKYEKGVEYIENNLDKLEKKHEKTHDMLLRFIGHRLVKKSSPLTLTDFGTEISDQIGGSEIAKKYADKLLPETRNLNTYQIQEHCFRYSKEKLLDDLNKNNPNQYELIHAVAFENGLEIDEITRAVGIKLRDAILSKSATSHSGIDKHSP